MLLSLLTHVPAGAAEPTTALGRMTGFLDGDMMDWHLIRFRKGGALTSSAAFRQTPHKAELILHGYSGQTFASKGSLTIDARFRGIYAQDAERIGLDILYLPDGMRGPLWTTSNAPQPPDLEIIALEIWGEVGRVEAVFSGQLCRRRFIYSPTEPANCKTLSGHVITELTVE